VKQINRFKPSAAAFKKVLIYTAPICVLIIVFIASFRTDEGQQFSMLAQAFQHGQLNFLRPIGGLGQDPLIYNGRIFWGEGPFPAVLLLPFVAVASLFHTFIYQGYIQWLLIVGIIYFVYKIARKLAFSKNDSIILMFGFVLGSVFIGVAAVASSWLFAQVVATFLLFWSLYEYYYHKRWWLIGIICGFLLLTRATAAPIIIFFVLELWRLSAKKNSERLKQYIFLLLPMFIGVGLIALYNYLRFQSPFNAGYAYQLLYPASNESKSYGIFSIRHIPASLYAALFRPPLPVQIDNTSWTLKAPFLSNNPQGMSIFFTSPYLLNLFTHKWLSFDKQARNLLIAIVVSILAVLSFYGLGMDQFGYRYSLDFLPPLFVLFMIMYRKNHSKLTPGMKFLLITCGIFNFLIALSFIFPTN
jgi:hypothetical protein